MELGFRPLTGYKLQWKDWNEVRINDCFRPLTGYKLQCLCVGYVVKSWVFPSPYGV